MKNIHLLPTDKASRLWLDSDNKLWIHEIPTTLFMMQNIYITSDEEIKDGDWYIHKQINYLRVSNSTAIPMDARKIILTTDQDLIKYAVQAIDNTFLEWFVKNPSCESVKIESWQTKGEWDLDYKIIIPKEEPKQKQKEFLIQMMQEDAELGLYELSEKDAEVFFNEIQNPSNPNKALVEAAERYSEEYFNRDETSMRISKISYIDGAKWQAERMYSEEEVRKLLETQRGNCYVAILIKTKDEELAAIAGGAPEPSGYNGWVK
jgi:hypothetical protein